VHHGSCIKPVNSNAAGSCSRCHHLHSVDVTYREAAHMYLHTSPASCRISSVTRHVQRLQLTKVRASEATVCRVPRSSAAIEHAGSPA
jgi:hypothetical protein